jgi:16S rRNA processing protein RimM
VGRVTGHRGARGELTVRAGADAAIWTSAPQFWLALGHEPERRYEAERARAYKDRLVLKLRGIDDANAAARLRGAEVRVAAEDAPQLPADVHFTARLLGLEVVDHRGRVLGTVADVTATGGTDLLRVRPRSPEPRGEQAWLLIPMARSIVVAIDEQAGRITVCLPEGLEELNR